MSKIGKCENKQKTQKTCEVFCAYNRVILSQIKTNLPYLWEKISYILNAEFAIIKLRKNNRKFYRKREDVNYEQIRYFHELLGKKLGC